MDFDWDDANIGHLALHSIEPFEAEDVFYGLVLRSPTYLVEGEERRDLIGRAGSGRILKVVYTVRQGLVRVCTAYAASNHDREAFRRKFGNG